MEDEDIVPYSEIKRELWDRGDLSYLLDSLQLSIRSKIYGTTYDKVCILSSRQIGKSYLACVIAIEFCIQNPGTIVRILSATLKQVSDIVNDNLSKIMLDAPEGMITRQKSDYRWVFSNGSSLRLGSLERSNVDNNRGGNAALLLYEECGFISSDDFIYAIDSVLGPQLLRSGGREIHISTPSEDQFHYLHEVIKPQCELSGTFFRFTVDDSPSLSAEQIRKAEERCGGRATEAFRREYLAEVIRGSSLMVIPEFDETLHVREFTLPPHYKACIAIDLGGSMDMNAVLSLAWDFKAQKLLVWDGRLLPRNTEPSRVVTAARELEADLKWVGEPARYVDAPAPVVLDWLHEHNYMVHNPLKDDRDAQIAQARLMFLQGKVVVHPRCKPLIGCLRIARYNIRRTDFERSELFGHADPLMAFIYGMRMIDRVTNPYPKIPVNWDTQIETPGREPDMEALRLEDLARTVTPFHMDRKRNYG